MEREILSLYEEKQSVKEVAKELDMSTKTLYRFFTAKEIPLKRGRRSGKIYPNTSPIKRWILSHPGEVLEANVEDIARRFNLSKQYVWDYLGKVERRLLPEVAKDKEYFKEILQRPTTSIAYGETTFPINSIQKVVFVRKKYTRKFRLNIILHGGKLLKTEYFDYKDYGKVLRY